MALVCVSGVYHFPDLVKFGGRIKDGPAKSSISISLTSTHPRRSINSKYLVCPADDELLPCLISCFTFDDAIHTLSVDIMEESEANEQRVRDIVGQVVLSPHCGFISNIETPSPKPSPEAPLKELIVLLKQEGKSALPTDPPRAADLWLSAVYMPPFLGTHPWLGSVGSAQLLLECLSNLLLASIRTEAFDVAEGILTEGLADNLVRRHELKSATRARCLYRMALVYEARGRQEALRTAVAAWHCSPNEKPIQELLKRLQASYSRVGAEVVAFEDSECTISLRPLDQPANNKRLQASYSRVGAEVVAVEDSECTICLRPLDQPANNKRLGCAHLWFGRTSWLIIGQHANGNFEQLKITNTAAVFASWERKHQVDLRKLVTVLARLREAVKERGGSHCVAIFEKTANTPEMIKVYPSHVLRKAVPDDLRRTLWDSWSTGLSAR
ncbi:hypothetical protein CcaCcLH18_05202 [Colletotrichum camelliae]|nr:hypothetical protein CcaCcLH18_05202 [Colletotrichum camelliae]